MLFLCLLMYINVGYMHYEVYFSKISSEWCGTRPFLSAWIDVTATLLLFLLCTAGRRKSAFVLTYSTLMVFVVANMVYSRFFNRYITPDVLDEAANFRGSWWMQYVPHAFCWTDLLLVVTTLLFGWGVRRIEPKRTRRDLLLVLTLIVLPCVLYTLKLAVHWRTADDVKAWIDSIDFREDTKLEFMFNQEYAIMRNGILLGQVYGNIASASKNVELSDAEVREIGAFIKQKAADAKPLPKSLRVKGKPNVVFIMVESYLSVASQMKIDGKEVTPCLNELMSDPRNYHNLNVTSNRGGGESSDAQISYFTGLLPLQSEMSVQRIIKNRVAALPRLLHEQKGYHTYITIPTNRFFWHQNEANLSYGIDHTIELGNYENGYWCQDEEIFNRLQNVKLQEPYMNIILTLSMHGSYDTDFLAETPVRSPFNYPSRFSAEFCHYLDKCFYTDLQIERYIVYLKRSGQYDNTVLIVCSDHEPKEGSLGMDDWSMSLPLIIANTHIAAEMFYVGSINQIDLYPTMLDMFGLQSEWRGMGHSLLRKGYNNTISDTQRRISNNILRGGLLFLQR